MTSLDIFPSEIVKKIIESLPIKDKMALRRTSHRYNSFVPYFTLPGLKMKRCTNTLRLAAFFFRESDADYFLTLHKHATSTAMEKHEDSEMVTCFRSFSYPPSGFSLFTAVRIAHLEMSKKHPIYFEGDNIRHLSSLLFGCKILKITLVVDIETNFARIPQFLESVHADHVEFIVQGALFHDVVAPFLNEEFAVELGKAGIREVSFSGDTRCRIRQHSGSYSLLNPHPRHGLNRPSFPVDVLLNFFGAGIKRIFVNQDSLENASRNMNLEEFDSFLEQLAKLATPLKLQFSFPLVEYLEEGRYRRNVIDDCAELVRVAGRLTTIEFYAPPSAEIGMVRRRFRDHIPPSELHTLMLAQDGSSDLAVYSRCLDLHIYHNYRIMPNRSGTEKRKCFSESIRFPPVHKLYSIFPRATTIGSLVMSKNYPLLIDGDNVEILEVFLAGFTAHKVSLVFDMQTLRNINRVLPLLASLQTKHVEFVIRKADDYNILRVCMHVPINRVVVISWLRFASELVNIGVGAITFTGFPYGNDPNEQQLNALYHQEEQNKPPFNDLLEIFVAGIDTVIINPHVFDSESQLISKEQLDSLLEKLAALSKPLRLQLVLGDKIDDLPDGRYRRIDDEREIVFVAGQLITIMYNP